jgi:hypothetical protein
MGMRRENRGRIYWRATGRGPSGATGPSGDELTAYGQKGSNGTDGSWVIAPIDKTIQKENLSLTFFQMLLHEAELNYLNRRTTTTVEKLLWIKNLIKTGNHFAKEAIDLEEMEGSTYTYTDDYSNEHLLDRSTILLIQISQGLDFYGHIQDYVPLTSIDIYNSMIDDMLKLASNVQVAYDSYFKNQQNQVVARKAIENVLDNLETQFETNRVKKNLLAAQIEQTRDQIDNLLSQQIQLEMRLFEAERAFRDAVSAEASCKFEEVLRAGASIAGIASGFGDIGSGIALLTEVSDIAKKEKFKERFKARAKYIAKHSKVVKGGINEFSEGYSDIKSIIEQERDGAKLIAEQGDFEAAIKKFEHLPEARRYRDLMNQFLSITSLRNRKILEVDTKTTQIIQIELLDEENSLEISSTKVRLLEQSNPVLSEYVVFFDRALSKAKASLLRAIVMEHRALSYWSLKKNLLPANISDRNISQIMAFHLSFKDTYLKLIEERNETPQTVKLPKVVLSKNFVPDIFIAFYNTGQLTFTIDSDLNQFKYFSRVLVKSVKISLSLETESDLKIISILRHHGQSTVVDRSGTTLNFSHRIRDRYGEVDNVTNVVDIDLGGKSGTYAFLSPFATWTLFLDIMEPDGSVMNESTILEERNKLEAVTFEFTALSDTRYGAIPDQLASTNSIERGIQIIG